MGLDKIIGTLPFLVLYFKKCWVFREIPYQGPCQNSKNTARPPTIGAALVGILR